jgi:hypothetical protein
MRRTGEWTPGSTSFGIAGLSAAILEVEAVQLRIIPVQVIVGLLWAHLRHADRGGDAFERRFRMDAMSSLLKTHTELGEPAH